MWTELAAAWVSGACIGVMIGALLRERSDRPLIADLHNRLAARTYGEYAAFLPTAAQEPPFDSGRRLVFDDTGLLEAEVPND